VSNMTTPTPEEPTGCTCGARPEDGRSRCRKCLARARWRRRQIARRVAARRRGITRRPPHDRPGAALVGVAWS